MIQSPAVSGSRYVVLVTGPPCSGKTTWVRQRAQPGDLVLDADTIARRLGSPDPWLPAQPYRDAAQDVMRQQMAQVAAMPTGTAYVIRSVPDPVERGRLAKWLRADVVVVLLPAAGVLMGRARARPRPYRTTQAIRQWMVRYRPAPGDHLNPHESGEPWRSTTARSPPLNAASAGHTSGHGHGRYPPPGTPRAHAATS